jgi:hypothetical protein
MSSDIIRISIPISDIFNSCYSPLILARNAFCADFWESIVSSHMRAAKAKRGLMGKVGPL